MTATEQERYLIPFKHLANFIYKLPTISVLLLEIIHCLVQKKL